MEAVDLPPPIRERNLKRQRNICRESTAFTPDRARVGDRSVYSHPRRDDVVKFKSPATGDWREWVVLVCELVHSEHPPGRAVYAVSYKDRSTGLERRCSLRTWQARCSRMHAEYAGNINQPPYVPHVYDRALVRGK
jgi:hypothetical protein